MEPYILKHLKKEKEKFSIFEFDKTNKMSKLRIYLLLLTPLLLQFCHSRTNELNMPGYELTKGEVELPAQAMEDIIDNISSPIEMAALIKNMGVPFSNKYLINLDNINSYSTNFKMAYNLGILGADLGYLNVYEKTGTAINYLSAINKLADALKVSQFFDFSTLKRLATGNSNMDSLIFLSVHSYNEMDDHLRETDRSNLSALMVAGVWIEGMYQVTQVALQKHDDALAEYIGEQKLILNDLLLILKNYERDEQFAALIKDYELIKAEFDNVKIRYEINDPEEREENGMLVIVQKESSVVNISKEVLNDIILVTERIRNKHLKL